MNFKLFKWVAMLLLVLGISLSACSSGSSGNPSVVESTDNSPPDQPSPQSLPQDIVSGDKGQLLDDFITQDNPLFSGSILVAQDGEILLSNGYNFANWELKAPNSALTKYRISSITKPFTATLILMLAEEGLLDLEDRLCAHLPDCPDTWQEITVLNLLTHTSGIPDYTTLPGADEASRDPHGVTSLVNSFKDEPLEFSPGETYQYSNSNYILLGAVIEQVSGNRYEKFLERAILNPLKIEDTGMEYQDEILKDRAAGYQIQGRVLINAPYLDMSNAYAAAGMYSTVGDLFVFDQALTNGQLLNLENQELMYSPILAADGSGSDYGLGWQLRKGNGHRRVGHSGGINGFRVFLGRYLDDDVTIILLTNIQTEDIDPIIDGLEQIVFDEG
jgi:CubicO group peptidase (beta-lactamase class C family)